MSCFSCCPQPNLNNNVDIYQGEFTVEDGDYLQEMGNRNRTMEMIRQMMNQNDIIDNQPPPAYSEYSKYALATDTSKYKFSGTAYLAHTGQPSLSALEYCQPVINANPALDRTSMWEEPVPRPSGDPPPVPSSWLRSQWESFRRSVTGRLSNRSARSQVTNVSTVSATNSAYEERSPESENCPYVSNNSSQAFQTLPSVFRDNVPSLATLASQRLSAPLRTVGLNEDI